MLKHGVCEVCFNSDGNVTHVAQEMMFGFKDRFEYLECGRCGCLQLKDVPSDLSRYYPPITTPSQKPHLRQAGGSA